MINHLKHHFGSPHTGATEDSTSHGISAPDCS